jgi:hypothetical protein
MNRCNDKNNSFFGYSKCINLRGRCILTMLYPRKIARGLFCSPFISFLDFFFGQLFCMWIFVSSDNGSLTYISLMKPYFLHVVTTFTFHFAFG